MAILERLRGEHAFDPAPDYLDLGSYHVPFDSLTGAQSFEAELSRAVRSGERVALVGPSGGGKSSVVASTFGPLEEGIAPIRVRVRACGRRNRHDTT